MDDMVRWLVAILSALWILGLVEGHGRLIEPPSRSSMWRFGYNTPKNEQDTQLWCGGVVELFSAGVDGKCGVCGDPWNGPRENEAGGKYATGTIVRKYEIGQVINVKVDVTINHKGYFEFRICPVDDPSEKITWDCLNQHLLTDASTGETRHMIESEEYSLVVTVQLRLPKNMDCKACMLQWKYKGGDGSNTEYYGCADVAIGHDDVILGTPSPTFTNGDGGNADLINSGDNPQNGENNDPNDNSGQNGESDDQSVDSQDDNSGQSMLGRQSIFLSVLCLTVVSFVLSATSI